MRRWTSAGSPEMGTGAIADFRVLVVPGLHGSGPEHWQTRWQRLYPAFERVEQMYWDVPDLDAWSERLAQALHDSSKPVLIVAHSFGCLATIYHARRHARSIAGALLVAPADPHKFDAAVRLSSIQPTYPSILVGSTDDPWMSAERAAYWANMWSSDFVNAGASGHINADSSLQDWRFGLCQLHRLAAICSQATARTFSEIE
jgi:predicted alpha/beta hydrolase family esterase